MTLRIRHPGEAPKDIELGPANGRAPRNDWFRRLPIDEQIAFGKTKR